jgi:hypothetical protein
MNDETMICKSCGKPLSNGDYGYYCSNPDCPEYDVDILSMGEK